MMNLKLFSFTDGPSIKVRPMNVEGEPGSMATLSCIVEGHPLPKIQWLRYENERFIVSTFFCNYHFQI